MKLFVKVFLIVASFYCFSSFAVKGNYTSILKKEATQVKTFSEFQKKMKKDFLEIRRGLAGQSVLVSIKESAEKKSSEESNPSSI